MTWTYSGDPSTSTRNFVRFLIHDTDSNDPLFSDEEINHVINEWSNDAYESARELAEILIARFARIADSYSKSVGDMSLSESYGDKVQHYKDLAHSIMMRKMRKEAPMPFVNADSLKATANRTVSTFNTDFNTGIHDNPNSNYSARVVE